MTQPNEKTEVLKPWVNPYPPVHPCTSTEQILERIARAIEDMATQQAGTNVRLASLIEGLAEISVVLQEGLSR